MTDTRHPGLITPDNAPRLADLNDDAAPYPSEITITCDGHPGWVTAYYLVPADSTQAERFGIARDHLRTRLGWSCDEHGDYCPDCVKARAAAPYETETDRPECPDCGNGCGGHAPETYHVDCGENVTDCTCPNRPTLPTTDQILANLAAIAREAEEPGAPSPITAKLRDDAATFVQRLTDSLPDVDPVTVGRVLVHAADIYGMCVTWDNRQPISDEALVAVWMLGEAGRRLYLGDDHHQNIHDQQEG